MRHFTRQFLSMTCSTHHLISIENLEQQHSCHAVHTLLTEGYQLSYQAHRGPGGLSGRELVLRLLAPDGRRVTGAQVIVTVVDALGNQRLARSPESAGGYLIDLSTAARGICHIEVEVITGGRLLTDYFTVELEGYRV